VRKPFEKVCGRQNVMIETLERKGWNLEESFELVYSVEEKKE
jgi:DNA-binding winged helix-turn-helix (wHTH) protein